MIFWLLVGIAIGYFFKPQLDRIVHKAIRAIKENNDNDGEDRWK